MICNELKTNGAFVDDIARNMLLFFSTTIHPANMYYQTVVSNIKELEGSRLAESTEDSILYYTPSNELDSPFITEENIDAAFDSKAMFIGRVDPKQMDLLTMIDQRIN